jgi:dihydroorotate dehydrogenase
LRELQEKEALGKILSHLQTLNKQKASPKPILLKIAPDLTVGQLDDIIDLAMALKLDGLVATNTTLDRSGLGSRSAQQSEAIGAGGLSGAPLKQKSTEIIRYIHAKTGGSIPVIASGGIFNADDAREKLEAGASLVQVWTGFVYEGPAVVKKICRGLAQAKGN